MKRIAALTLALCLTLTGCQGDFLPYARDIEAIELIRTLGIDVGEKQENVMVTVSGGVQRTGDNGQGEKPSLFSQEGRTLYDACSVIQTFSDDYISFGHVTEWVLGEDVARQGVTNLLDFMERDEQMRLSTKVFVVKGGTAEELLRSVATEKSAATDRLSAIELDYQLKSIAYPYTVKELLSQLEENGCGLVPALVLEGKEGQESAAQSQSAATSPSPSPGQGSEGGGGASSGEGQGQEKQEGQTGQEGQEKQEGQEDQQGQGKQKEGSQEGQEGQGGQGKQEEKSIRSVGCGYFKDNRLIGFLDERQARGTNLLLNQARSGTVEVELPGGEVAALRMVKSRCKWELHVEDDVLVGITAQLEVEADLAEIRGESDPDDPQVLELLRQGLSDEMKREVEDVFQLSQREEADFLHLRRRAAMERPWLQADIEEHWDEWFPQLELNAEVKGVVRRSYDVDTPMKGAGEESK